MRKIELRGKSAAQARETLRTQWLVTNGLGGFASGTISGAVDWKYHGILVAALPAPLGRTTMLSHLAECIRFPDGSLLQFGGAEPTHPEETSACAQYLTEFRLENHLPIWTYEAGGAVIEKRLLMPHLQNTVHITYSIKGPAGIRLELRPSLHFRPFESPVNSPLPRSYQLRVEGRQFEVHGDSACPPLRLFIHADSSLFIHDGDSTREIFYQRDAERGYESRGLLWSPGYFAINVSSAQPITFIASSENWNTIHALDPLSALETETTRRERLIRLAHPSARSGPAAELVLAADQFIIIPAGRIKDAARARAAGDELRSVIAGYHWFTDWGRDTMISLEGLTLTTGRFNEARWILQTFAHYVKDGLLPNMFPEGTNHGLYHTADATLWFFQAVHRYVLATEDRETLRALLPILRSIAEHHIKGTKFGIRVDPSDGLLSQGAEGYQLTWMDAKVADWVVTPRRGKAVEINALWYNALSLLESWLRDAGDLNAAEDLKSRADQCRTSFNQRFWNESASCLFDVVDGEKDQAADAAIRPNQILAISLSHPVLDPTRWAPVVEVVRAQLVTPVGLRSLAPGHLHYKSKYFGDLRARDAAYHQGTVWAWLIGPFIDAWLRVHPQDLNGASAFLSGFLPHLDEGCVGSINEIFDAESPYTPRGCIAQAWSVAEVLRSLVRTSK